MYFHSVKLASICRVLQQVGPLLNSPLQLRKTELYLQRKRVLNAMSFRIQISGSQIVKYSLALFKNFQEGWCKKSVMEFFMCKYNFKTN
jgi:hypothetical protein